MICDEIRRIMKREYQHLKTLGGISVSVFYYSVFAMQRNYGLVQVSSDLKGWLAVAWLYPFLLQGFLRSGWYFPMTISTVL